MTRYRLDPQFHCSHLDSRGVPEKPRGKKRGKLSPFHFRFTTSGDVISGDATSGRACARDHFRHHLTAPPQMLTELCPYTTDIPGLSISSWYICNFMLEDIVGGAVARGKICRPYPSSQFFFVVIPPLPPSSVTFYLDDLLLGDLFSS